MRKKCIAIAKKAMVWSLAAAMLVTTPLTASAAGLRDVYKVEDGWGDEVPSDSKDSRTGTVTSTATGTDTGVLGDENKLTGIVLSETEVQMEMDGAYDANHQVRKELTVEFEGNLTDEEKADLSRYLTWKTGEGGLSVVALNNRVDGDGNKKDPNGVLNTMTLIAKAGGKTTVTVSLDDYKDNIHFTTSANVSVKQYASDLDFSDELDEDAYEGATLDLNDYLEKTPETANDEITYAITDGEKLATLKNNVLKLKTKTAGKSVTVVALGEHEKSDPHKIEIKKANPATKVEIYRGSTKLGKTYDWLVNVDGEESSEFKANLVTKDGNPSTDKVTWSAKKSDVVSVVGGKNVKADTEVTLVAKKVGKETITVQASSGKKATLNVTVRANMTGFTIEADDSLPLYSGQALKLGSTQEYKANGSDDFTETALAWAIEGANSAETKAMKKVASINSKGILTIKPDIKDVKKIRISATNAKAIGKNGDATYVKAKKMEKRYIEFELKKIDITSITVYSNLISSSEVVKSTSNGTKVTNGKAKKDQQIAVDKSKTYKVVATAKNEDGTEMTELPDGRPIAAALGWVSSNETQAKAVADNNGNGTVTGVKKGKPTITISGATLKKGKPAAIKATFKANVTVPTKSIVLSTKNSGIAATNKNQTITVKATLEKGTTSKTKDIVWTATKNGEPISTTTSSTSNSIKGGKLALKKGQYAVGDVFVVTAKLVDAGVRSSITLKVVQPSDKVQFTVNGKVEKTITPSVDADPFEIQAQVKVKGTTTFVTPDSENNVASVKYTVNKKGIVQIVGNKVTPIKKGTVKVTATTSDGKKATLTIKVQ